MISEEFLQSVESYMLQSVRSDVPILQTTSQYIIDAGGKRLRPRIMALSYLAAGGDDLTRVVPVAAALELLHTASLVHDDINDQGSLRRGKETINSHWGISYALLTGDYLFARVYQIMSDYHLLNKTLAETSVTLVEGEALQATASDALTLNHDTYNSVIIKKTASLFRAAALMGGQLADANDAVLTGLADFGVKIGLVFQLVDDVLDLIGDPQVMGKNVDVDYQQRKGVTAAILNGKNQESPHETQESARAEAVKLAQTQAADYAAQASQALSVIPHNLALDELRDLIQLALNRRQ